MPSITRSQSKMNNININITSLKPNIRSQTKSNPTQSSKPNTRSQLTINNITITSIKQIKFTEFIRYIRSTIYRSELLSESYDQFHNVDDHFDNIRLLTEMYYYINESADSVLIIDGLIYSPSTQKLINTIYNKIIEMEKKEMEKKINRQYVNYKKLTNEQHHILKCFIQQMSETKEKLYSYVTEIKN